VKKTESKATQHMGIITTAVATMIKKEYTVISRIYSLEYIAFFLF